MENSVMAPLVLMRPILLAFASVNQRLPSGPAVMQKGLLKGVGTENSVIPPLVVMRPISSAPLPVSSVNQRLPSGPAVMPKGLPPGVGTENSVMVPLGVMRPILFARVELSVNQRLPSGPAVMPSGPLLGVGTGNSLMLPTLAQAVALLRLSRQTQAIPAVTSAARRDRKPELFMISSPCAIDARMGRHFGNRTPATNNVHTTELKAPREPDVMGRQPPPGSPPKSG